MGLLSRVLMLINVAEIVTMIVHKIDDLGCEVVSTVHIVLVGDVVLVVVIVVTAVYLVEIVAIFVSSRSLFVVVNTLNFLQVRIRVEDNRRALQVVRVNS